MQKLTLGHFKSTQLFSIIGSKQINKFKKSVFSTFSMTHTSAWIGHRKIMGFYVVMGVSGLFQKTGENLPLLYHFFRGGAECERVLWNANCFRRCWATELVSESSIEPCWNKGSIVVKWTNFAMFRKTMANLGSMMLFLLDTKKTRKSLALNVHFLLKRSLR